ncbi:hypothetical protein VOLCADRAFT_106512 [Volvox carteri f. nagariensis]|uniref:Uncharacterized protein n=1 Tax=Volvox carteri f. nagariensis TaxID=3068 RepID=D8U805_VOLCA|nr:uncharacterized protein VOLCADRAFT_106512 [Volvox carteri f. nagariensis]EFJ44134.1 hypothetical protein VOLCADRAFT_106512 [Volvox carteri f. nagariensis]|eukprot:XP_002954728.1 hypothetical protein VOLCADRAFT_106512 [Volvox carteri f. nagariensis]
MQIRALRMELLRSEEERAKAAREAEVARQLMVHTFDMAAAAVAAAAGSETPTRSRPHSQPSVHVRARSWSPRAAALAAGVMEPPWVSSAPAQLIFSARQATPASIRLTSPDTATEEEEDAGRAGDVEAEASIVSSPNEASSSNPSSSRTCEPQPLASLLLLPASQQQQQQPIDSGQGLEAYSSLVQSASAVAAAAPTRAGNVEKAEVDPPNCVHSTAEAAVAGMTVTVADTPRERPCPLPPSQQQAGSIGRQRGKKPQAPPLQLQEALQLWRIENTRLQEENSQLRQDMKPKLRQELQWLTATIATHEALNAQLQSERDAALQLAEGLQEENAQLHRTVADLHRQLHSAHAVAAAAAVAGAHASGEDGDDPAMVAAASAAAAVAAANARAEELEALVIHMQREVEAATATVEDAHARGRAALGEAQERVRRGETEAQELRAQLEAVMDEVEDLRARLQAYEIGSISSLGTDLNGSSAPFTQRSELGSAPITQRSELGSAPITQRSELGSAPVTQRSELDIRPFRTRRGGIRGSRGSGGISSSAAATVAEAMAQLELEMKKFEEEERLCSSAREPATSDQPQPPLGQQEMAQQEAQHDTQTQITWGSSDHGGTEGSMGGSVRMRLSAPLHRRHRTGRPNSVDSTAGNGGGRGGGRGSAADGREEELEKGTSTDLVAAQAVTQQPGGIAVRAVNKLMSAHRASSRMVEVESSGDGGSRAAKQDACLTLTGGTGRSRLCRQDTEQALDSDRARELEPALEPVEILQSLCMQYATAAAAAAAAADPSMSNLRASAEEAHAAAALAAAAARQRVMEEIEAVRADAAAAVEEATAQMAEELAEAQDVVARQEAIIGDLQGQLMKALREMESLRHQSQSARELSHQLQQQLLLLQGETTARPQPELTAALEAALEAAEVALLKAEARAAAVAEERDGLKERLKVVAAAAAAGAAAAAAARGGGASSDEDEEVENPEDAEARRPLLAPSPWVPAGGGRAGAGRTPPRLGPRSCQDDNADGPGADASEGHSRDAGKGGADEVKSGDEEMSAPVEVQRQQTDEVVSVVRRLRLEGEEQEAVVRQLHKDLVGAREELSRALEEKLAAEEKASRLRAALEECKKRLRRAANENNALRSESQQRIAELTSTRRAVEEREAKLAALRATLLVCELPGKELSFSGGGTSSGGGGGGRGGAGGSGRGTPSTVAAAAVAASPQAAVSAPAGPPPARSNSQGPTGSGSKPAAVKTAAAAATATVTTAARPAVTAPAPQVSAAALAGGASGDGSGRTTAKEATTSGASKGGSASKGGTSVGPKEDHSSGGVSSGCSNGAVVGGNSSGGVSSGCSNGAVSADSGPGGGGRRLVMARPPAVRSHPSGASSARGCSSIAGTAAAAAMAAGNASLMEAAAAVAAAKDRYAADSYRGGAEAMEEEEDKSTPQVARRVLLHRKHTPTGKSQPLNTSLVHGLFDRLDRLERLYSRRLQLVPQQLHSKQQRPSKQRRQRQRVRVGHPRILLPRGSLYTSSRKRRQQQVVQLLDVKAQFSSAGCGLELLAPSMEKVDGAVTYPTKGGGTVAAITAAGAAAAALVASDSRTVGTTPADAAGAATTAALLPALRAQLCITLRKV